ncbi:DNA/RNA non-specific endonuclease [Peribacillus faecalis]|nr:DNA/RNA non-specific endonuclease [Peribacillus faecalis]
MMKATKLALEWYELAEGYDANFLSKQYEVPLPELSNDLKEDIAPLLEGGYILNYTHFSIVMSKSRRLAFYTAVNIDGSQQKDIKRGNDSWYYDPRIDEDFLAGPELYSNNDLDRGHLVRRRDPVWGTRAAAANEDTFHFTNCAPQHKNFNQKTWLDLEDYILNNAVTNNLKVNVFTGPVFKESDQTYRGIQLPEEFWKIAVMIKHDGTLSATAYLQTQKNLLGRLDFSYGEYKTYQVAVSHVERLTGLDFGTLRDADPLGSAGTFHTVTTEDDIRF